jgi:signal transduction histidine kinase
MKTRLTERDLSRIVRRVVKEDKDDRREIGRILDDIISSFEFSEKGNDEMLTLAKYILENPEQVANMIMGKLKKGYGAHDEDEEGFGIYTSKRDELKNLQGRLGSKY